MVREAAVKTGYEAFYDILIGKSPYFKKLVDDSPAYVVERFDTLKTPSDTERKIIQYIMITAKKEMPFLEKQSEILKEIESLISEVDRSLLQTDEGFREVITDALARKLFKASL